MPLTLTPDDIQETAPAVPQDAAADTAGLLICLPALAPEALSAALSTIATAFPDEPVLVASPHQNDYGDPAVGPFPGITILPYPAERANLGWVLAASDYASAARLATERNVNTLILLADAPASSDINLLQTLALAVRAEVDLALPRFNLGPTGGLVNSALLYPLNRALFGADVRFPLPADAAMSPRMAQRLAVAAQRVVAVNQGASLFWPVAEAAIAGLSVREVDAAESIPPAPPQEDFNSLFGSVAGSLFADVEARASFWQRARNLPGRQDLEPVLPALASAPVPAEIQSIIESFQLAQNNLQEIWSLVLPPQSRLAFKKLSQVPAESFAMDPALWARTVYDFALAFHLRTLNRNHLLGAMTPLYLAWVASHLLFVADNPARAARAAEQTAEAFETEKSYFVSRWRWPDRFNP